MENNPETQEPRRRRRRSHKKSSKVRHQQRMQMKKWGYLLLTGAIGVVLVAALAVFSGASGN